MSIKAIRVMTSEEGDEEENPQIINETKSKRKCLIIIGCGAILALALTTSILSLVLFCQTQTATNTTDEQAVDILDNLEYVSNFTESDLNSFDTAFNVFDHDNDGFLNETEFAGYFGIELNRSSIFRNIDVDNDTVLSYPEVVAYVSEMAKKDVIFNTLFKNSIIPAVMKEYNYKYNGSTSDALLIEYAAMFMYFDVFDVDSNGYIRHDEYLLLASTNDFMFADVNSDEMLSKDELNNLLYGNDEHSFSGAFQGILNNEGDALIFAQAMASISVTMEQVMDIDISLCPIKSGSSMANERRRLQSCGCPKTIVKCKSCPQDGGDCSDCEIVSGGSFN